MMQAIITTSCFLYFSHSVLSILNIGRRRIAVPAGQDGRSSGTAGDSAINEIKKEARLRAVR
jgi:hypothetical protein